MASVYKNFLRCGSSGASEAAVIQQPTEQGLRGCAGDGGSAASGGFDILRREILGALDSYDGIGEDGFLARFEADCGALTVRRAADYDDLFNQLGKILKRKKVGSYCVKRSGSDGLVEELGIRYFMEDKGIVESEDGGLCIYVADMLLEGGYMLFTGDGPVGGSGVDVYLAAMNHVGVALPEAELYGMIRDSAKGVAMVRHEGSAGKENEPVLFVVDNGRGEVLKQSGEREMLACVGCGRCMDVCPVTKMVGKEGYSNVIWGPPATVLLPRMEDEAEYGFMNRACTLCGRCEEVCPMGLDIRIMVLRSRESYSDYAIWSLEYWRRIAWRQFLSSRAAMSGHNLWRKIVLAFCGQRSLRRIKLARKPFGLRVRG